MTTRFWWIRHGPTHAKGFVGWADIPADLSDVAMLSRIANLVPASATLVSSDLQRAVMTADAIGDGRTRWDHDPMLREMNYGDWDGMAIDEVSKTDAETSRKFWQEPGATAAPNGESWDGFSSRIFTAVDALAERHGPGDIVAVAHFGVILAALQRASGMTAKSAFSFKIDNLSVTRIDYIHKAKAWRVNSVNILA